MQKTTIHSDISVNLDSRQRRELAALLKKCSSMSDPKRRELIVADLAMDYEVTIPQTGTDTDVDIRHIINICIQHNGFENLIDAMQSFDADAPSLKRVYGFINDIYEMARISDVNIRKKEQYDALEKILSSITVKQLEKIDLEHIYVNSVPPYDVADKWGYSFVGSQRETLMAIVEKLKGAFPQQGELYANQKFMIGLALQLPEKKRADLDGWVSSTVKAWGTEEAKISDFCNDVKQEWQQRKTTKGATTLAQLPHLLISLEAPKEITRAKVQLDKLDETKFCVTAWLFYGKDNIKCIHVSEANEFYTGATMPGLLAKLRRQVDQSTEIDTELKPKIVIDFFLKHEFFVLPVERWEINEKSTIAIGEYHPVVMRSFERLVERRSWLWKMKWEQVHNPSSHARKKHICWIYNRDELGNATLEKDLLPEHITCLGLMLAPLPIDDLHNDAECFYSLLNSLTNTGTPIALWLRDLPAPEELDKLKELIELLLSRRYVSQLPQKLKIGKVDGLAADLSKEERKRQMQILSHLVLLWEDPNVMPADEPCEVVGIRNS